MLRVVEKTKEGNKKPKVVISVTVIVTLVFTHNVLTLVTLSELIH